MEALKLPTLSPIKFFVEPVAVAINYLQRTYGFRDISMIGISGGGWTTTLYAAIDPRVAHSIPVARAVCRILATAPARSAIMNSFTNLYSIANYFDLYVLGASGIGRSQVQILNEFDTCCFWGVRSRFYEKAISAAVSRLGDGQIRVLIDDSHHEHKISTYMLETAILHELQEDEVRFIDDGDLSFSTDLPWQLESSRFRRRQPPVTWGGMPKLLRRGLLQTYAPGVYQAWTTWPADPTLTDQALFELYDESSRLDSAEY